MLIVLTVILSLLGLFLLLKIIIYKKDKKSINLVLNYFENNINKEKINKEVSNNGK